MMLKISSKAHDRLKKGIQKYAKILGEAREKSLNEADTSFIINDMLGELLGYDKFFEVTAEHRIRGQFVDYAVKLNNQLKFFVEVKSINTELGEQHLWQATNYAANEGVSWAVLTNGDVWQVYNIIFSKPLDKQLVLQISLLDEEAAAAQKLESFFLLSKEGFLKDALAEYMERKMALSPENIVGILLSAPVLDRARKEIKASTGYNLSVEDLREFVLKDVVKVAVSPEILRKIGRVPRKSTRKNKCKEAVEPPTEIKEETSSEETLILSAEVLQ